MTQERYHKLYQFNRETFGGRVFKASLDAGLTCPNRDGTLGLGGCIYCDQGSRYFAGAGSIRSQMEQERRRIQQKWPGAKLIAYFQAGTNTYAPVERLRAMWTEALDCPDTVGLSIATRADCLGPEVLELLAEFQGHLTVELGLQTIHDDTARRIGRGHNFATFLRGYEALRQRDIRTCVHLIDGLPGENRMQMLETAQVVGSLRPGGVKLHLLHVNEGTALAQLWRQGEYRPLERADYVEIVTEQLRYFPWDTVIERLTGDGDRRRLLAPLWSRDKIAVLGAIEQRMRQLNLRQGDCYENPQEMILDGGKHGPLQCGGNH